MVLSRTLAGIGLLVGVLAVAPGSADVLVWFDPQDLVIPAVGNTTDVEVWANFTDPIVAWGLDLTVVDTSIAAWTETVIGGSWDETATLDGDGLAGLRFPPGLTGDVLLATLVFTGLDLGTTGISLGYSGEEDEGFLLEFNGLDEDVTFVPGTITVIPEPTLPVALGIIGLLLRRR
jgi:hypothetical protein